MKKIIEILVFISLLFGIVIIDSCKKDPVLPTLTTNSLTNVTINSVNTGGSITSNGDAEITARGVCWNTAQNPTTAGSHTSDGKGTGNYTSEITGLTPNTLYYVRAYATNSVGTAYGNEVSITTSPIVVASLTTTAVSSITLTTAVSGGNITSDGGGEITSKGVCWATTANPTISNDKSVNGTGTGNFTSNLSGLLPGTTYYVRAYSTNSAGTAYGNEVSFTSGSVVIPTLTTNDATSITLTTAVSGGNITSDGGGDITAKGVCWATAANPTIADDKTLDGTGTGSFTSDISGLQPGTTYYIRAYATNSAGTAYGNEVSFGTTPVVLPALTTNDVSSITISTAISGGNITSDGGGSITARGICWATTTSPTTASNKITDPATGTGTYISNLTGLLPGTTYYVRAFATNSAGTAYGNEVSFTTSAVVQATLTTTDASLVTLSTATSGGNVTNNGGGAITERGVCWAITQNPTTAGNKLIDPAPGTGSFISNLTGLTPGTTYYLRAYAINSAGTAYGNQITFTTTPNLPSLATTVPSSIGTTTASSGGNITDNGGGTITERGVCFGITQNPTTANAKIIDPAPGTGIFTGNLTGLQQATTYYVRAYAINSAGTAYGNQVTFNTKIADADGNTYNIVFIGTQVWMVENLKTTRLHDIPNTPIDNVEADLAWTLSNTPAYCWYANDIGNKPAHGAFYNWFAVNSGNLCPSGWHVPSDGEFKTLELYLGMLPADVDLYNWRGTNQGAQMKNTTGWAAGENGTNISGFSALPSGYRYAADGSFNNLGNLTYWWTSTEDDPINASYRRLDGNNSGVYRSGTSKEGGKSVRCLKD